MPIISMWLIERERNGFAVRPLPHHLRDLAILPLESHAGVLVAKEELVFARGGQGPREGVVAPLSIEYSIPHGQILRNWKRWSNLLLQTSGDSL